MATSYEARGCPTQNCGGTLSRTVTKDDNGNVTSTTSWSCSRSCGASG